MKVTVFGAGYVGLVTGACLADVGHDVMCVDIDATKVANLQEGIIPIYEPGLDEIVLRCTKNSTLQFTTSAEEGVNFGKVVFIAVGTPSDEDGSADLQYVLTVASEIGRYMPEHRYVINKSTVPVGTADKVQAQIASALKEREAAIEFNVISNPEFLKEGAAIQDFMRPERIIVGTESTDAERAMRELYAPFNRNHDRLMVMDIRSAELTKYAANAMLATKISFMNEIANIADKLGADVEQVRKGIGSDSRIGYHFIYAGCGYGGSCFPKDVRALAKTAEEVGYAPTLIKEVESVNDRQKQRLIELILNHYGGEHAIKGKTFAIWGLAFKPNTDDMRDAPSRPLIESLLALGAKVQAFDPVAIHEAQRIFGTIDNLFLTKDRDQALGNADGLVICTEWKNFAIPDIPLFGTLKDKVIFDGRNIYDPNKLRENGLAYYGIGRSNLIK